MRKHPAMEVDGRGQLARDLILAGFVLTGFIYLAWRTTVFNDRAPVFSTVFYLAEIVGFLAALLRLYVTRGASMAPPEPPPPPPDWPTIDVMITTYREPAAIVRRTLAAAAALRGPCLVWLLDDGRRPEIRDLAAEFGCRYLTRDDNIGAKAGNLNHALRHADGNLLVVLDVDHAPEPRLLERLVGYFSDPAVALVQTPQDFFNTDSFQHGRGRESLSIWHEASVFHWVEQPGRAALGAVSCCGSSMMLRRAALDAIGGFPAATVTEDMHASVKLHKLGWRIIYHAEPLAYGVAPAGPRDFLRQRLRWGQGNMQVCRREGIPFARDLSIAANLAYLMMGTVYLEAWLKLVIYAAPIISLFTLHPPIWTDSPGFLLAFAFYFAFGLLAFVEFGRGYAPIFQIERFAMTRLASGLGATLGLVLRDIPFRATSKAVGGEAGWRHVWPQWAILVLGLAAVSHGAWRLAGEQPPPLFITLFIMILALYHAGLAVWVLLETRRCARLPAGDWRCPEGLPLRLDGQGSLVPARGLSAAEVEIDWPDETAAPPSSVTLYLPGRLFQAAVVRRQSAAGRLRLAFDWPSAQDRDELERSLLAERWRRVLAGRQERRWTWLEALGVLPRSPLLRPWGWGVWRRPGANEGALACVQDASLVLFGADGFNGGQIDVELVGSTVRRTVASGPRWRAGSDMDAVAAAGGAPYRFA